MTSPCRLTNPCSFFGTLKELKQLEKLFKGQKPRVYKQADATEAVLQSLNKQGVLAKYRYLVFSAHGYLSPNASMINPPKSDLPVSKTHDVVN
ncbi:MAG: hypothetical protein ABFS56_28810 [Pseudomonadota bacterium]